MGWTLRRVTPLVISSNNCAFKLDPSSALPVEGGGFADLLISLHLVVSIKLAHKVIVRKYLIFQTVS